MTSDVWYTDYTTPLVSLQKFEIELLYFVDWKTKVKKVIFDHFRTRCSNKDQSNWSRAKCQLFHPDLSWYLDRKLQNWRKLTIREYCWNFLFFLSLSTILNLASLKSLSVPNDDDDGVSHITWCKKREIDFDHLSVYNW